MFLSEDHILLSVPAYSTDTAWKDCSSPLLGPDCGACIARYPLHVMHFSTGAGARSSSGPTEMPSMATRLGC